jgi:hypothetical protein
MTGKVKNQHRAPVLFISISNAGVEMQIKIEAQDMLGVLVDAGIDATDAKAIIFDLLQLPEAGPERKALLEARRARKTRKREVVKEEYEEEEEEEEDIVEKKEATQIKPPLKTTKVRKPKRVNFSTFGGVADPLRS